MIELPFYTEMALHMISGVSGVIGIGQYASHVVNTKRERDELSVNFHKSGYWLTTVPELQESSEKTLEIVEKVTPLIKRLQLANASRYGMKGLFMMLVLLIINFYASKIFSFLSVLGEGWDTLIIMATASVILILFTLGLVHCLNIQLPENAKLLTEITTGKLSSTSESIIKSKDAILSKINETVDGFGCRELDENERELIAAYSKAIYMMRSIEAVHAKRDLDSAIEKLKVYSDQIGINNALTSTSSGREGDARH